MAVASNDINNLICTDVGLSYIQNQKSIGQKVKIGYFKLGDSILFTPTPADVNVFGNNVFTSEGSDIWWISYPDDEIIFRAIIDSSVGDFYIGNIGIFTDTGILLFIAKFDYVHHKMKSTEQSPGGRWTCQFRIRVRNALDIFDVSLLTERYSQIPRYDVPRDAPEYPFYSFNTEIQVDDCLLDTNRSAYVYITGDQSRKWYTPPFQHSEAYVITQGLYELDGGYANEDDHKARW